MTDAEIEVRLLTSGGSWWAGSTREELREIAAYLDRTRFRLQTKHIGSFDTPGPGRMTRPKFDRDLDG